MKKIIHFFLFIIMLQNLNAQSVNIPLDHWVYDYLDRLETKGVFRDITTKSYPLLRTDVAALLSQIERHRNQLTAAELALFEQLKGEFHEELKTFGVRYKPRYKERHLFTWAEKEHFAHFDLEFSEVLNIKRGNQYETPERTSLTTLGGIVRGQLGRALNFYIRARNTLNRGTGITTENFDPQLGAPIVISGKNVYSDDATAYSLYKASWLLIEFGRDKIKWGPGYRGALMVSRENPQFELLKLKFKFKRFQFTSFHGVLHSNISTKYLVGHRLELKILPWLYVSGSEAVVYGNRNIEPAYLNPLMPYHVAEHHLGDRDNNTMAFDITVYPLRNHKFYAELFLDDFTTARNPFTYYGNKFAFLAGQRWVAPLGIANADFKWEYARIEPYVYTHKDSVNVYKNYNRPIGHWLGPNSDDLFMELGYLLSRDLKFSLNAARTRHGEGDIDIPHTMADGKRKKFLSGTVETRWSFGFSFSDQLFRDIFLTLNYYYTRINNLNRIAGQNATESKASFNLLINW